MVCMIIDDYYNNFFLFVYYIYNIEMSESMYCVKCKEFTETSDLENKTTANGREMLQGRCNVCGTKKTKFVKSNYLGKGFGGNPALLAQALPALAEVGKSMQGTIQQGLQGIDNQLQRGFEKKQMTGEYERKEAKNARAVVRKRMADASKLAKKYNIDFDRAMDIILQEGGGEGGKVGAKPFMLQSGEYVSTKRVKPIPITGGPYIVK